MSKEIKKEQKNITIYSTEDGKTVVSLFAKDGSVWMNKKQLADLFDTSKQNIGQHTSNIFKEHELEENSVVKNFFTTAFDREEYKVTFYSFEVNLANS